MAQIKCSFRKCHFVPQYNLGRGGVPFLLPAPVPLSQLRKSQISAVPPHCQKFGGGVRWPLGGGGRGAAGGGGGGAGYPSLS